MAETGGLFVIDFESGDNTDMIPPFDSTAFEAGFTHDMHADATAGNGGSSGFRIVQSATGNDDCYGKKAVSDLTDVYVRAYIKISDMQVTQYSNPYILSIFDGVTQLATLSLRRSTAETGSLETYRILGQGISTTDIATVATYPMAAWHRFEMRWRAGTGADGGVHVYIDGVDEFSELDNDLTAYAADDLRFGLQNKSIPDAATIYYDDIKVMTDGWPGAYADAGGAAVVIGRQYDRRRRG